MSDRPRTEIYRFVNSRSARPAPQSGGQPQITATSAFITPQSLVSFPLASGLVAGLWRAAQTLVPHYGSSPWVALGLALTVGAVIYVVSTSDPALPGPDARGRVTSLCIGAINCLYLFMAALGIQAIPTASR